MLQNLRKTKQSTPQPQPSVAQTFLSVMLTKAHQTSPEDVQKCLQTGMSALLKAGVVYRHRAYISCWCFCAFVLFSGCAALRAAATYAQTKPILRGVRVFGGANEMLPPIILRTPDNPSSFGSFSNANSNANTPQNTSNNEVLGANFVTVEVDVQTQTFPNFVVTFVHCDALWREDVNNIIINNPTLRTTQVDVRQASFASKYFTHRASFTVPNSEIKIQFSGNWKAKIFETSDLTTPVAEARFFVAEQIGACSLGIVADTYRPRVAGASPASYILEASIQAPPDYLDDNLQTVMFFRNHRWNEPRIVTQNPALGRTEMLYNNSATTTVLGFTASQKRFRIIGIPAENEYRVLDVSNPAFAPAGTAPIRFALADLRRNGGVITNYTQDGALITHNVSSSADEYVFVEFVFDPENAPSSQDIFVVGSFNNWQADPAWKLTYNAEERLYKLRQWIRRGRHNYLYATGRINAASGAVENISFEECEGNALSANHTFYALFYYQNPNSGRYDALYGVAGANTMRRGR